MRWGLVRGRRPSQDAADLLRQQWIRQRRPNVGRAVQRALCSEDPELEAGGADGR
jgi:hypothetical protein